MSTTFPFDELVPCWTWTSRRELPRESSPRTTEANVCESKGHEIQKILRIYCFSHINVAELNSIASLSQDSKHFLFFGPKSPGKKTKTRRVKSRNLFSFFSSSLLPIYAEALDLFRLSLHERANAPDNYVIVIDFAYQKSTRRLGTIHLLARY